MINSNKLEEESDVFVSISFFNDPILNPYVSLKKFTIAKTTERKSKKTLLSESSFIQSMIHSILVFEVRLSS